MRGHPYRAPEPRRSQRAKAEPWTIALVVVWFIAVARALAVLFDRSLAGPITGLSVAIAIVIPVITLNAHVLAGGDADS